jgi:hypothetical protein
VKKKAAFLPADRSSLSLAPPCFFVEGAQRLKGEAPGLAATKYPGLVCNSRNRLSEASRRPFLVVSGIVAGHWSSLAA